MARPLPRLRIAAPALFLLVLGAGARLAGASTILGGGGPHLVPTDSHYYLRFAQLQQGAFPALVRFDPLVNFPEGAEILWPPIHTWLVALSIWAAPPEAPPEAGAVWLGPLLFLVWAAGLGWLARRVLGTGAALWLMGVLALTPLAVADSALGEVDHHVHEAPWVALVLLLAIHVLEHPRRRTVWALAIAIASGRLLTTSGFLGAPLVAGAFVLDALLRTREQVPETQNARWRSALGVGLAATLLQTMSAAAWGDLRSLDYTQLSAFHPLWTAGWCAFAAGVSALSSGRVGWPRVGITWGVSLMAGLILVRSILEGLGDAARADAVLSLAAESRPLWGDPVGAVSLLGVGWMLWLLAVASAVTGSADRGDAWRLRLAVGSGLPLLLLSLLQIRLTRLGVGASAVAIAAAWPVFSRVLRERASRGVRVAFACCIALFVLSPLARASRSLPYEERHLRESVEWLAGHAPFPGDPPEWAVLSTWTYGHILTAWGGLPVLATPFSQAAVHERGNARALDILREADDRAAYERARAASIRYVLAAPYHGSVGPVAQEPSTLMARLLEHAGMGQGHPGSGHFRLIYESEARRNRDAGGPLARIFEVVEGALLVGSAAPDSAYVVQLELVTARGEPLSWERAITTDAEGRFAVRAPYPTERDPRVEVWATGPYRLMGPEGPVGRFELSLEDVHTGATRSLSPVVVAGP
ncbi:MAG TPA: STT3 domain-containing protein [Myxococcaceae bacterium]|nr:STT3 domain-containing protein [Myxococcaceae bacterium]